ncbi:unnamed protein product [Lupinus luteus]|uniref:Uncharacterized protein n=1 Tax=Lupinus luteus TaxID=3873 RepID=A0AAV1XFS6_LUPLU
MDYACQRLMLPPNFHSLWPPFGAMSLDNGGGLTILNNRGYIMDYACQRLMLPHDHASNEDHNVSINVKPIPKLLSLEWQDQGCSDAGKESFGYLNGPGSSTGYDFPQQTLCVRVGHSLGQVCRFGHSLGQVVRLGRGLVKYLDLVSVWSST